MVIHLIQNCMDINLGNMLLTYMDKNLENVLISYMDGQMSKKYTACCVLRVCELTSWSNFDLNSKFQAALMFND